MRVQPHPEVTDGGGPPAVEFLDPDPGAGADGPLEALPGRPGHTVALVLAAAAVLVVGTLAARTGDRSGSSAAGDAPSRALQSAEAAPARVESRPLGPVPSRVPPMRLLPTPVCPLGCYVLWWVPDATSDALHAAFPEVFLYWQVSAFAKTRAAGMTPLFAREIRATAGRAEITVDVVAVAMSEGTSTRITVTGRRARAVVELPGYSIAAEVVDGGRSGQSRLQRLVRDPVLFVVR